MNIDIYGFAGWIGSFIGYAFFIIWAYIPDSILKDYGITYLPSKYWIIAIPTFFIISMITSGIFYIGINKLINAPLDSYYTIADKYTKIIDPSVAIEQLHANTPEISDISIKTINEIFYDYE